MSSNYRKRKKKIIFFGDSITEAGAFFGGYIQRIAKYLENEEVANKFELVGMGKSGNKITDLYGRLGKDILEKGADVVVIYIGINDIWHKYTLQSGTAIEDFERVYIEMIEQLKSAHIKAILCTPSVIGENIPGSNVADNELNNYSDVIRKIAEKYELPLADLRTTLTNFIIENNKENNSFGVLTTDGVHLNEKGNQLVANEIWNTIKELYPIS